MKECAFCTKSGKMSSEHIIAQWIRKLVPGEKTNFFINSATNRNGKFRSKNIDWKANVVCETCNNTWMSGLENTHGQAALTPLIIGAIGDTISPEMALSITIYAFKTAVVANHADRKLRPFFPERVRSDFSITNGVPDNVDVWICGIKNHRSDVHVQTAYYAGHRSPADDWKMFVFTCAIGSLVMQLVSVNQNGNLVFSPNAGYENIGISMRRPVPSGYVWPGRYVLDGADGFKGFADRWKNVLHGYRR